MMLTVTHDIFYDLTAEYFMQYYSFFLLKPSISAPRGASWGRGGAIFPAKHGSSPSCTNEHRRV